MTNEEAIKILTRIANNNFYGGEVQMACRMGIEALSQPSLPSNLDGAALKVYPKMSRLSEPHGVIPADSETHYLGDANEENRVAFKAGAEWMAGHGETKEAVIGMATEEIFIKVSEQTLDELDLRPGDKVVVQIRKK